MTVQQVVLAVMACGQRRRGTRAGFGHVFAL